MKKKKVLKIKTLALKKSTVANLGVNEMLRAHGGMAPQEPTLMVPSEGDETKPSHTVGELETKGCNSANSINLGTEEAGGGSFSG